VSGSDHLASITSRFSKSSNTKEHKSGWWIWLSMTVNLGGGLTVCQSFIESPIFSASNSGLWTNYAHQRETARQRDRQRETEIDRKRKRDGVSLAALFSHFHIAQSIRCSVSSSTFTSIIHASISLRMDYHNSLFLGLPIVCPSPFWSALNTAARLVCTFFPMLLAHFSLCSLHISLYAPIAHFSFCSCSTFLLMLFAHFSLCSYRTVLLMLL